MKGAAGRAVLPGPALGEMPGEPTCLAGDAPSQGDEASPEGLGGRHEVCNSPWKRRDGQLVQFIPKVGNKVGNNNYNGANHTQSRDAMASQAGFEPAASCLEGSRSIH